MFWFSTFLLFAPILWSTISSLLTGDSRISINGEIRGEDNGLRNYDIKKYTDIERNAIAQFRVMVDDILDEDYEHKSTFLIRWIRACSMDLKAAEEMLRKAKKWRKDNNIDNILKEKTLDLNIDLCPIRGVGYDGNPVFVINMASTNIRKIMMAGQKANLTRRLVQCLESVAVHIRRLSETTGTDIGQVIGIADVGGYNLKSHACPKCISLYMDFMVDAQNYYPEYLRLSAILNSPRIMKPLFELSKPFLHSSTLKSIKIFGPDKREWSSFLLKFIPPDQLSSKFGGTAEW